MMTLRVTNATFSTAQGDFATVDEAYLAIAAGLEIAVDKIRAGERSAIVEVAVDVVGRRYAARGAVAVSTSRMLSPVA
ncbi:hypothetical protein AB5I41_18885 [Sphingomonas sp. MMS24-JH45]